MTGLLDLSSVEAQLLPDDDQPEPVAIIGLAGRFPMATDLTEFWENLAVGRDCHRPFPATRGAGSARFGDSSRAAGYLTDIAAFDHAFFDISRREACLIDPNQRLFLEEAYHAIEDAGLATSIRGSDTGVWVGHSRDLTVDYATHIRTHYPQLATELSVAGNMGSVIASRISYFLDLHGPSVSIDTACSSGLMAVAEAVRALQRREVRTALAGSVKVNIEPIGRGLDDEIGIRAADDRTKTFDRSADGISSGEGACVLVLKLLSDAQLDGDRIRAVILSVGSNQDGRTVGITAPNPQAQTELLANCWAAAEVEGANLVHLEAHGTGTRLGDPIEVSAMREALSQITDQRASVALGSVKPNIGHLDHLAPLASVAKSVLLLQHEQLPPTISLVEPNPRLDLIDSALYINDRLRPLPATPGVPLAGVSAFGLAGTNVHLVLAAPPAPSPGPAAHGAEQVFMLSARSAAALRARVSRSLDWLAGPAVGHDVASICAATRRTAGEFAHRLACVAGDGDELVRQLSGWLAGEEDSPTLAGELPAGAKPTPSPGRGASALQWAAAYVAGSRLPAAGPGCGSLTAPGYAFEPIRCWPDSLLDRPILPTPEQVMASEHETIFRLRLDVTTSWLLAEHRVADSHVLPGMAFVELIIQLARRIGLQGPLELSEVFFLRPLALAGDESAELGVVLRHRAADHEFEILLAEDDGWQSLVTGRVRATNPDQPNRIEIPDWSELSALPDAAQRRIEVRIGRHWTGIERNVARLDAGCHFARLEVPTEYQGQAAESECYPPLLDRAFNALNAHLGEGTYLPFSIARMQLLRRPGPSSVARLRSRDADPGALAFDIALTDPTGAVVVHAEDFQVRRVDRQVSILPDHIHEPYWRTMEQAIAGPVTRVVVVGAPEVTAPLRLALAGLGVNYLDAPSLATAAGILEPGDLVLDTRLWGHPAASELAELNAASAAVCEVAPLLARLDRLGARLVILVGPGAEAGIAWSFAKAANEEFRRPCRVIEAALDLDSASIVAEALAGQRPDQVRLRAGQALVEEFVPAGAAVADPIELGPDRHHLVAGYGDLASVLLPWLAAHGPVRLTVLGRRPPGAVPGFEQTGDQVERLGSRIQYLQCDITDRAALAAAIRDARASHGPIQLVWQLAGLTDEALLGATAPEQLAEVLAPKVRGTWLLDELTRTEPLQAFVLFSSISSLAGGIGQGGYCAANGYLDRFAEARRGPGQTLTLNWAAWLEQGMATRYGIDDTVNNLFALNNNEALELLAMALAKPRPRCVLGRPNPAALAGRQGSPLVFAGSSDWRAISQPGPGTVNRRVLEVGSSEFEGFSATERLVAQAWRTTLGDQPFGLRNSFTEVGGDSILAVRLLRELRARFGEVVDISAVFTYPTIESMATHLDESLAAPEPLSEVDELDDLLTRLASGEVTVAQASARTPWTNDSQRVR